MDFATLLKKSATRLQGLHPKVRATAEELIKQAHARGINVLICQGYRSFEEQAAIYAQGRTKPGKIVTNAKPGYSYHNYGLAIDFCLLDEHGGVHWEVNDRWREVARIGKSLGFEWGGDWKDFKDYPHLQMTFGLSISDLLAGKRPPKGQGVQAASIKSEKPVNKSVDNSVETCGIEVDGKTLAVRGILRDGKSLLPVRAVAEAVGGKVEWCAATKQVKVNGKDITETIENGTSYAPARELAAILGLSVEWDQATKTVKLKKGCV